MIRKNIIIFLLTTTLLLAIYSMASFIMHRPHSKSFLNTVFYMSIVAVLAGIIELVWSIFQKSKIR